MLYTTPAAAFTSDDPASYGEGSCRKSYLKILQRTTTITKRDKMRTETTVFEQFRKLDIYNRPMEMGRP